MRHPLDHPRMRDPRASHLLSEPKTEPKTQPMTRLKLMTPRIRASLEPCEAAIWSEPRSHRLLPFASDPKLSPI